MARLRAFLSVVSSWVADVWSYRGELRTVLQELVGVRSDSAEIIDAVNRLGALFVQFQMRWRHNMATVQEEFDRLSSEVTEAVDLIKSLKGDVDRLQSQAQAGNPISAEQIGALADKLNEFTPPQTATAPAPEAPPEVADVEVPEASAPTADAGQPAEGSSEATPPASEPGA